VDAATLRDFAEGGRYHKVDPPLKPMSGGDFEKWRLIRLKRIHNF
jgi:hypothetical protein